MMADFFNIKIMIELSDITPRESVDTDYVIGYSEEKEVVIITPPDAKIPDDVVRYDENGNLNLEGNIILKNDKKLLGTTLNNSQINIIECSRFTDDGHPIVDIASTTSHVNISAIDRPTIQLQGEAGSHDHEVAFLADIESSTGNIQSQIDEIKEDITGLDTRITENTNSIDNTNITVSAQGRAINKAQQDIENLQTDNTDIKKEIDSVKDDITTIKEDITTIENGYVKNGLNTSNVQISSPIIQLNATQGTSSGFSLASGTLTLSGQSINTTVTGDINLTTSTGNVNIKGNPILSNGEGGNFLSDNGAYLPVITDDNFDATLSQHLKDAELENVSLIISGNATQTSGGNTTITSSQKLSLNGTTVEVNGSPIVTAESNVASATKLQTTRSIYGQPFDGSQNVSGAISDISTINTTDNIYLGGVCYTDGKTITTDGKQGSVVGLGTLHLTSDANPLISFYRVSSTSPTATIINSSIGLEVTGTPFLVGNNDVSNTMKVFGNITAQSFNNVNIINSGTGNKYLSDNGVYNTISEVEYQRFSFNLTNTIIEPGAIVNLAQITCNKSGFYNTFIRCLLSTPAVELSTLTSTADIFSYASLGISSSPISGSGTMFCVPKVGGNTLGESIYYTAITQSNLDAQDYYINCFVNNASTQFKASGTLTVIINRLGDKL